MIEIVSGLRELPDGTARGCLRPLAEAQAQLATVRSEHIIHESPIDPESNVPPLFRGELIDQRLRHLMSSVSTALQTAHRLSMEEPKPDAPEERIASPRDATTIRLIESSEALEKDASQSRNEFDIIRNPNSEHADTLRRRLTDVIVLNSVGRAEIRMAQITTARLKRIAAAMREYPAAIKQAAHLIKVGADFADYAQQKWSSFEERLFRIGTNTIREVAEDIRRFAERLEPSVSTAGETAKGKGREPLDPTVDFLSAEHMIARGEVPPSEIIPYLTSFNQSHLEQRAISALGQMTELRILRLNGSSGITDVAPLAKLSALQLLDLENTQIAEIEPLAKLSALQTINLSGTKVRDLNPLEKLFALQSIDLSRTQISDLEPLVNLTTLKALYLNNTRVSDLKPLAKLSTLKTLYLNNTQISDLKPLANLSSLQTIDLIGTKVSDLKPLTSLSALRELYLSDTMVSDLRPLVKLSALQSLYLANTDVNDLRPLANLPALKTIILSRTKVWDLGPLKKLFALQSIVLSETKVRDLKPLASLSSLETINLHNTQVIDLSPLRNLPQLRTINIPENNSLIATLGLPVKRGYDSYEIKRNTQMKIEL
jgi:Leucine-rich repeat (LRR) protein